MSNTIAIDGLEDALHDILEEYTDEIARGTKECVQKVARAGVKALKAASPKRTGYYAKDWTSKIESGRLNAQATIYNNEPGLPHLLEFGHVSRNGTGRDLGQVPGQAHIQPVEEELAKEFKQAVEEII